MAIFNSYVKLPETITKAHHKRGRFNLASHDQNVENSTFGGALQKVIQSYHPTVHEATLW